MSYGMKELSKKQLLRLMYVDDKFFDFVREQVEDFYIKDYFVISWCPFCEVQRQLVIVGDRNYWCPVCSCVVRKFGGRSGVQSCLLGDYAWYKYSKDML